jgi:hypothetical protein
MRSSRRAIAISTIGLMMLAAVCPQLCLATPPSFIQSPTLGIHTEASVVDHTREYNEASVADHTREYNEASVVDHTGGHNEASLHHEMGTPAPTSPCHGASSDPRSAPTPSPSEEDDCTSCASISAAAAVTAIAQDRLEVAMTPTPPRFSTLSGFERLEPGASLVDPPATRPLILLKRSLLL